MQNLIPAAAGAQFLMFQGAPKSIKKRCQKDFEIRPHLESEKKKRKSSQHRPDMGSKNGRRCDKKSIKKKMKNDFKKRAQKNMQKNLSIN